MSFTQDSIERHLRDLSDTQKSVLAAAKANTRTQLIVEAAREVRDTQRHAEMMAAQGQVSASIHHFGSRIADEIRQVALILLEQTAQLKRIADTLETPRATQARELRGMASKHVRAGNLSAARSLLVESLDLDGTEHATYLMLGFLQHQGGDSDAAVETLLGGLSYASGSIDDAGKRRTAKAYTLHMAARIRASQQRYQQAAELLARAMDQDNTHSEHFWHELASYLMLAGEGEQALGALACLNTLDRARTAASDPTFLPIAPAIAEIVRELEARDLKEMEECAADVEQELQRARPLVTTLTTLRRRYARRSEPLAEEACIPRLEEALGVLREALRRSHVLDGSARQGWSAIRASQDAAYEALIQELRGLLRTRRRKRLIRGVIATPIVLLILLQLNWWRAEAERKEFEAGLDQRWYVAPMTGFEMGAELAGLLYAQDRTRGLRDNERQAAQFAQALALLGPFQRNTMPDWVSFDILTGMYGELARLTDADDTHHLKETLENLRLAHFGTRRNASGMIRSAREDTTRAMFDERRTLILMRHVWVDLATQDETSPAERAAYQPLIKRATEMIESFAQDESFAPSS